MDSFIQNDIKNKIVDSMNKLDTFLDTVADSNCCNNCCMAAEDNHNNCSCKVMVNMNSPHNHIYYHIILDFLLPTIIMIMLIYMYINTIL